MNNYQTAGYEHDLHDSEQIGAESMYTQPFPVSDFGEEGISLEEFEKLSGTSYIDFLRSQDDML
ncbi:MAG TPA: hypothetical protein VGB44_07180 [Flavobacterium sp.]|jgi:hypothetical protein